MIVFRLSGSIEDAEISPQMAGATFDGLFRKHMARLQHLKRLAMAQVRALWMSEYEPKRKKRRAVAASARDAVAAQIKARTKAYADAVVPEPVWWKSSTATC